MVSNLRQMAARLNYSETTFPPQMLIPMIAQYALEQQNGVGPRTWVPDLFIACKVPFETIIVTLQSIWYAGSPPFADANRAAIGDYMLYVCQQWYDDCVRNNKRIFDGEENAEQIAVLMNDVATSGLFAGQLLDEFRDLINRIRRSYL
jgi:nuclear pore complex protein Nup155